MRFVEHLSRSAGCDGGIEYTRFQRHAVVHNHYLIDAIATYAKQLKVTTADFSQATLL